MAVAGKVDVLDTMEGRKAVQAMATYLGIDAVNEKQLLWIAERALLAPLPRNWEEISTPDGKVRPPYPYTHNPVEWRAPY